MPAEARLASPLSCPKCRGSVDVKSRHVAITGTTVLVYCSAECLRTRDEPQPTLQHVLPPPRRRRWPWWLAGGVFASTAALAAVFVPRDQHASAPPDPPVEIPAELPSEPPQRADESTAAIDSALLGELMHDAWIHPLAGPERRMPKNHNGAFGASRPGERPPECVSGHCGVDLGRVWGEPIHAVHDGVVDFVQRGTNDDRGGMFVRVAHRGGTLFSWYFHLAAVPRGVQPGAKVRAGDVIGLLGDTGIKHSDPHLHFSLSVKPKHGRERYLDPEPLIAIWPLWIPNESRSGGRLSTAADPGVPVRASGGRRRPPAPATPAVAPVPPTDDVGASGGSSTFD